MPNQNKFDLSSFAPAEGDEVLVESTPRKKEGRFDLSLFPESARPKVQPPVPESPYDDSALATAKRIGGSLVEYGAGLPTGLHTTFSAVNRLIGRPLERIAGAFDPKLEQELRAAEAKGFETARKIREGAKEFSEKTLGVKPGTPITVANLKKESFGGKIGMLARGTVESVPATLVNLGMTLLNPAVGAASIYLAETGGTRANLDELEKSGVKIDPAYKDIASVGGGALKTALEQTGLESLVSKAPGARSKVFNILSSLLTEFKTEGVQELADVLTEAGAKVSGDDSLKVFETFKSEIENNLPRLEEASIRGGLAGGAIRGGVEALRIPGERTQAKKAEQEKSIQTAEEEARLAEEAKTARENLKVQSERESLLDRLQKERDLEVGGPLVGAEEQGFRRPAVIDQDIQKRLSEIPEEQIPSDPTLRKLLDEKKLVIQAEPSKFDLTDFKPAEVRAEKPVVPISERELRAEEYLGKNKASAKADAKSFNSALDDFLKIENETKGKPLSEQMAVAKQRLEAKGYHPAIVDELTSPERLKRPEIDGDVSEATTRPGRLKRAVEPPPELKEQVDLVADKAIKFRDAEASYNKGREEIFREVEKLGGKIIVDSAEGTFKIEIKPGKAKLSMQDQLALVKLKQEAAEAGAYSLATVGKGFQVAAAPLRIKQGESLTGGLSEKIAEFIDRKNALKAAQSDFRKSEKALVDPYIDFYFKNKLEGKENASLIGRGEVPVEVQLRRKPSDTLPDEPQARRKIVEARREMQKRASELGPQGEPYVETRKVGVVRAEAEKATGTSFFDIRGNLAEADRAAWDAVQNRAAESFARTSANEIVNPQVWKDLAETGYYVSKALGRASKGKAVEFAEWANQMVKQFGEKIRPILQDLWNDIKGGFTPEKKPVFYSHTAKVLENKLPNSAPAAQMKNVVEAFVKKGEIPKEEAEWSGLLEWLDKKEGKVTKQEVAEFLRENQIELREVEGGDEFEPYQLPGGENYKEILLTLPPKTSGYKSRTDMGMVMRQKYGRDFYDAMTKEESDLFYSLPGTLQATGSIEGNAPTVNFKSSHFDEPNILAHVRLNERVGKNGERILFLEEIQSDWHQQGREKGYKSKNRAVLEAQLVDETKKANDLRSQIQDAEIGSQVGGLYGELSVRQQNIRRLREQIGVTGGESVPDAPFKTSWHELAFKRMLRYAVDNDFDKIAWTTGEQQAARYDLAKQVDAIRISKSPEGYRVQAKKSGANIVDQSGLSEQKLADTIGKDLAKKAVADLSQKNAAVYRGDDLEVGGEGMKGFYDKIVPEFVSNYTKKWGGKVKDEEIRVGTGSSFPDLTLDLTPEMTSGLANAHVLDITPEMTAGVAKGQPLFGRAKLFDVTRNLSESEVSALNASKERLDIASREFASKLYSGPAFSPQIWKEYVEIGHLVAKGLARNLGEKAKITFENFKEAFKNAVGPDLFKRLESHLAHLWEQVKTLPDDWKSGDEVPTIVRAEAVENTPELSPSNVAKAERRFDFGLPLLDRLERSNSVGGEIGAKWRKAHGILKTTLGRNAVEIRKIAKEAGVRRNLTTPHLDVVSRQLGWEKRGANLILVDLINHPERMKDYSLTDVEKKIIKLYRETHARNERELARIAGREPRALQFQPTLNNEAREAIFVLKGGPLFEALAKATAERSGLELKKVKQKFASGNLSGLDIPTHVPLKGNLIAVGSADAISALQAQNFEFARTLGLLRTFGPKWKNEIKNLREKYDQAGGDLEIFDLIEQGYRGLRPKDWISEKQSSRNLASRLYFRAVDPVFSALALSKSAYMQITQPFIDLQNVGVKNFMKTITEGFGGKLSADDLERMGIISRDILNWKFAEGEKIEDYGRMISALTNRGDLMYAVSLLNDVVSASNWRNFVNSLEGKKLTAKDRQTLRTNLGLTEAEIQKVEQGKFKDPFGENPATPEEEFFVEMVRRGKTQSQHTGKFGGEKSKFQTGSTSPFFLRFQNYTIGEFQRWRRETANLERALKSGDKSERNAAIGRVLKLVGTTAVQGELINIIRHTIKGEWDESEEGSAVGQALKGDYAQATKNFLWNFAEAGFMGAFTRAYFAYQIAQGSATALMDAFFPTNIVHQLWDAVFSRGRYADKDKSERFLEFIESRVPATDLSKPIERAMAITALAKEDHIAIDAARRHYFKWLEDTGRAGEIPEKSGYKESRASVARAYAAMKRGDDEDVLEALATAFQAKLKEGTPKKKKLSQEEALDFVKKSLEARMLLSRHKRAEMEELEKTIGEERYKRLAHHDALLKHLANSLSISKLRTQTKE